MPRAPSSGPRPAAPVIAWELVRRDWETSTIGLRALARRHGIRFDNQIRRRRDKQGWHRDREGWQRAAAATAERLSQIGPVAADAMADVTTSLGLDQVRARILREQLTAAHELAATVALLGLAFGAIVRTDAKAAGARSGTMRHAELSLRSLLREHDTKVRGEDVAERLIAIVGEQDTLPRLVLTLARLADTAGKIEGTAWGVDRAKPLAERPAAMPAVATPSAEASPDAPTVMADPQAPDGMTGSDGPLADAWVAIRHAYETTTISLRRLAAIHGIRSSTTIRRRLAREDWQRDRGALIAQMTSTMTGAPDSPSPPLVRRGPAPVFPWAAIRQAYETSPLSGRELAARFGVSESRIRFRRVREGWLPTPNVTIVRGVRRLGRAALAVLARPAPPGERAATVRSVHAGAANGAVPGEKTRRRPLDSPSSPAFVRTPDSTLGQATPPTPNRPDESTAAERRAGQARLFLQRVEAARAQREGGMVSLRLIGAALTHPDAPTRQHAVRTLQLVPGNRQRGMVPLLEAIRRQIQTSVSFEDDVVEAWLVATAPPPVPRAP